MQNTRVTNLPHHLAGIAGVPTVAPTLSSTAKKLSELTAVTLNDKTQYVMITPEGGSVRVDPSGAAPTASVGQLVVNGASVLMSIQEATSAKWIVTAGDVVLQISQYQ